MIKILSIICFSLLLFACKMSHDTHKKDALCYQQPPTDELCQAYFVRWFYDFKGDSCKEISYGGCNTYGFSSKAECESCKD